MHVMPGFRGTITLTVCFSTATDDATCPLTVTAEGAILAGSVTAGGKTTFTSPVAFPQMSGYPCAVTVTALPGVIDAEAEAAKMAASASAPATHLISQA